MSSPTLLGAPRVLAAPDLLIEEGGVLLAGGRIERVLASPAAVRRAERAHGVRAHRLEGWLTPGLVNAHAHLELGAFAGLVPAGPDFAGWVDAVIELGPRVGARARQEAAERGAARLLATGTTTVGDVDTSGAGLVAFRRHRLRCVHYREVLDAFDPARTAEATARLARALPARVRRTEGISPHAPHTASDRLLARCAELARARRAPLAVHWSESRAEVDWLERGRGPFRARLGPSPLRPGLDRIQAAGLLGRQTALVHGNLPRRGEPSRIARAGASLVHCPGSHRWFDRPPFPLSRYRRAGVPVALGTDSLASNEDLDMRREMALLRAAHPELSPAVVWGMATVAGARALGLEGRCGVLARGAAADLVLWRLECDRAGTGLEALTSGGASLAAAWVAGRPVPLPR